MKKFKFTLESVARVKNSTKEMQETLLHKAQKELNELNDRMDYLNNSLKSHDSTLTIQMSEGMSCESLIMYNNYKTYILDSIEKTVIEIKKASLHHEKCRKALVETMREIKTLEKIRDKQYAMYLEEYKREEEKIIGDFVTFKVQNA